MLNLLPDKLVGIYYIKNKKTNKYYLTFSHHIRKSVKDITKECKALTFKNRELQKDMFALGKGNFEAKTVEVIYSYPYNTKYDPKEYQWHLLLAYEKHLKKFVRRGVSLYNIDHKALAILIVTPKDGIIAEFGNQLTCSKYLKVSRVTLSKMLKANKRFQGKHKDGKYPIFRMDYKPNKMFKL